MGLVIRPIRRPDPHIEQRRVKKTKPLAKYKENRQFNYRNRKPTINKPYKELTQQQQDQLKLVSIAHSIKMTKGATPHDRMIRRRRRKEYLRIKYKLQNRMKICTICKEEKAISDFDYQKDSQHRNNYRRSYCTMCRSTMNRKDYEKRKNR